VSFYHLDLEAVLSIVENIESIADKETLETSMQGELDLFRGYLCFFKGQGQQCEQYLRSALEQIPDTHFQVRGETELHHALAFHMTGHKNKAIERLNDLLRTGRLLPHTSRTRLWAGISFINLLEGTLNGALSSAGQLREMASKNNIPYVESWALYLEALARLFRNELKVAEQQFSRVVANAYANNRKVVTDSFGALRLIHEIMHHRDKAQETMNLFSEFVSQTNDPACHTVASSFRARLSLLRGDTASAMRYLHSVDLALDTGIMLWWIEVPRITECRVLIAEGSDASLQNAIDKLQQYEQENRSVHNTLQTIAILSLMALAYKKQGRNDEALTTLGQAIELGKPGGIVFPFIEIGPQINDLLKALIKQNVATSFVGQILAAFRKEAIEVTDAVSTSTQPLVEPLTKRELEILALLAQRRRNKEIAEQLFISAETVKRHTINIYQKLGVNDREQAVVKAETLGILPSQEP
jgi:LuxR family maltose regulon positive regulatory protein